MKNCTENDVRVKNPKDGFKADYEGSRSAAIEIFCTSCLVDLDQMLVTVSLMYAPYGVIGRGLIRQKHLKVTSLASKSMIP